MCSLVTETIAVSMLAHDLQLRTDLTQCTGQAEVEHVKQYIWVAAGKSNKLKQLPGDHQPWKQYNTKMVERNMKSEEN